MVGEFPRATATQPIGKGIFYRQVSIIGVTGASRVETEHHAAFEKANNQTCMARWTSHERVVPVADR